MNPETERAALLHVSAYVRRMPVDPYAELRKAKHDQLRLEIMERDIARIVKEECERGT
jgi:hypothetical protein